MSALCFACKTLPAGNDYGGPYSAYCPECQPRDTRPQPRGAQCWCARCEVMFATPTDFDGHLRVDRNTGEHAHLADLPAIGLEVAAGVWGTPEGNANRARKAGQLRAARSVPVEI